MLVVVVVLVLVGIVVGVIVGVGVAGCAVGGFVRVGSKVDKLVVEVVGGEGVGVMVALAVVVVETRRFGSRALRT